MTYPYMLYKYQTSVSDANTRFHRLMIARKLKFFMTFFMNFFLYKIPESESARSSISIKFSIFFVQFYLPIFPLVWPMSNFFPPLMSHYLALDRPLEKKKLRRENARIEKSNRDRRHKPRNISYCKVGIHHG